MSLVGHSRLSAPYWTGALPESRRVQGRARSLSRVIVSNLAFRSILDQRSANCMVLIPSFPNYFLLDVCLILLPGHHLNDATEDQIPKVQYACRSPGSKSKELAHHVSDDVIRRDRRSDAGNLAISRGLLMGSKDLSVPPAGVLKGIGGL